MMIPRLPRAACLILAACPLFACGTRPRPRPSSPTRDPLESVSARDLYVTGVELARSGDLVRAEHYLSTALRRGHSGDEVFPALIRVCLDASMYSAALHHARSYLGHRGQDWRLRFLVASLDIAVGDYDRARNELEQVVALAPDRPEPQFALGQLLATRLSDPAGAMPHLRRYLKVRSTGVHAAEAEGLLRGRARPKRRGSRSPRRPNG
jgi:tetratricopeptide (TPR) repeat protein